jgi:hypothetical protein
MYLKLGSEERVRNTRERQRDSGRCFFEFLDLPWPYACGIKVIN